MSDSLSRRADHGQSVVRCGRNPLTRRPEFKARHSRSTGSDGRERHLTSDFDIKCAPIPTTFVAIVSVIAHAIFRYYSTMWITRCRFPTTIISSICSTIQRSNVLLSRKTFIRIMLQFHSSVLLLIMMTLIRHYI